MLESEGVDPFSVSMMRLLSSSGKTSLLCKTTQTLNPVENVDEHLGRVELFSRENMEEVEGAFHHGSFFCGRNGRSPYHRSKFPVLRKIYSTLIKS